MVFFVHDVCMICVGLARRIDTSLSDRAAAGMLLVAIDPVLIACLTLLFLAVESELPTPLQPSLGML